MDILIILILQIRKLRPREVNLTCTWGPTASDRQGLKPMSFESRTSHFGHEVIPSAVSGGVQTWNDTGCCSPEYNCLLVNEMREARPKVPLTAGFFSAKGQDSLVPGLPVRCPSVLWSCEPPVLFFSFTALWRHHHAHIQMPTVLWGTLSPASSSSLVLPWHSGI